MAGKGRWKNGSKRRKRGSDHPYASLRLREGGQKDDNTTHFVTLILREGARGPPTGIKKAAVLFRVRDLSCRTYWKRYTYLLMCTISCGGRREKTLSENPSKKEKRKKKGDRLFL